MNGARQQLFNKLKEIQNDRDFVIGVMSSAKTEDKATKILDYIENGDNITLESIILFSLELDFESKQNK